MKFIVTILAALILTSSTAPSLPGPGIVRVQAETIRSKKLGDEKFSMALIYNPRITVRAIGNVTMLCKFLGVGGPLGSGTQFCRATYSMPHGKIMAMGLIKKRSFFSLAVIGGTGLYSNVGGEVIVSTYAYPPRQERLLFSLEVM
jgi:hypothetical protein